MAYQSVWIAKRDQILAAAERVKAANPAAWEEVKVPGQPSRRFIGLVAAECQVTVSPQIGCNLKRGGPDVSLDVLAMPNASGAADKTGTFAGLELIDIINGAEGPNPSLTWGDATQKTIDAGVPGGWIKTPAAQPGPGPSPQYPTYESLGGDEGGKKITRILETDYRRAEKPGLDGECGTWPHRTNYDFLTGICKTVEESIAKHQQEWRKALNDERVSQGKPPIVW